MKSPPTSQVIYINVRIALWAKTCRWEYIINYLTLVTTYYLCVIGVYFELNGNLYLNNSTVVLSEIGEGEKALLCKTGKKDCCGAVPNRFGQFYVPGGGQVPISKQQQGFYRNRGDQSVGLNRREGVTSPTGTYRCEIPDADDEMVKIYITLTGK